MRQSLVIGLLVFTLAMCSWAEIPQTISYQGILTDTSGTPVPNDNYELKFTLYDAETSGTMKWSETQLIPVVNGTFNVILGSANPLTPDQVDFTEQYWLGITILGAGGELTPRIQLTASAYSLNSRSVEDGAVTESKLAGLAVTTSKIADGAVTSEKIANSSVVRSLNGKTDDVTLSAGDNVTITPGGNTLTISATTGDFWRLTGNAGTTAGTHFLGTTDSKSLELRANNSRILYLKPSATSPSIIGGFSGNSVGLGVFGATIGGGGEDGSTNSVLANFGTVGGGANNQAGDTGFLVDARYATVSGGLSNTASGYAAMAPGGRDNKAAGNYSFAAGLRAKANHDGCFVWGDSTDADIASTASNQFVVRAGGGLNIGGDGYALRLEHGIDSLSYTAANFIAGYSGNSVTEGVYGATIGGGGSSGGYINMVTDDYGTVGGGINNRAGNNAGTTSDKIYATVSGGRTNIASGPRATVGGGGLNEASGSCATIPGGYSNMASGGFSFAAGRRAKALNQGSFVWADSQDADFSSTKDNEFRIRAAGGVDIRADTFISGTARISGSTHIESNATIEGNTQVLQDLTVAGDLVIYGANRGFIGPNNGAPFPRPAFDSGWLNLEKNESVTLQHGLGDDVYNCMVDMQVWGPWGIEDATAYGVFWGVQPACWVLTIDNVEINQTDWSSRQLRVRIWVYQ